MYLNNYFHSVKWKKNIFIQEFSFEFFRQDKETNSVFAS